MVSMTRNEASVIDEGAFTVRRTIRIAAPVDKVWRAVTEPEHISRWFGQTVLDGAGVGATGTMTFEGYGTIPLRVEAIDAPRSVSYAWSNDDAVRRAGATIDEATRTVFTFTLDAVDGGTELTVVETGFDRMSDPAANMADHAEGWVSELDKLVALLEGDA
ncbi:SRPBCC domain-containing protein [Agromyces sp. NPDC058126]|uniref:SRPBCC domain-containing protein n=1 Tax=Agromyces sp. NPDC058126 TaxID=3346350 RepID=UPI0036DA6B4A